MKTIILGTQGEQPFKINKAGVSHHHAKITIDDEGNWTLEDLNSTNGTFIREEDGEFRRVAKIEITEMTFILLGPNNANGCTFYAGRTLQNGGFTHEFQYLNEMEDDFDKKEVANRRMANIVRFSVAFVSMLACCGSFLIEERTMQMWLLRAGTMVSMVSSLIYNPTERSRKIMAKRDSFHQCPNPECNHILTTKEVRMMHCPRCKAQ